MFRDTSCKAALAAAAAAAGEAVCVDDDSCVAVTSHCCNNTLTVSAFAVLLSTVARSTKYVRSS